jgi:hypothetical protein
MAATVPSCPRCGYDLSGQADADRRAREGQLPESGRCSECGLEFAWIDVFEPYRNKVRSFIEHTDGWLFPSAWWTWLLALWPARFWRRIRIEMPVRPGRMVWWLVLVPLLVWAVGSFACDMISLGLPARFTTGIVDSLYRHWIRPDESLAFRYYGPMNFVNQWRMVPAAATAPLAAGFIIPAVFLLLPVTRKLAKVRGAHVLRSAIFGTAWILPVLVLRGVCRVLTEIYYLESATHGWTPRAPWERYVRTAQSISRFAHEYWALLVLVTMAWVMWWWWLALRRGWRVTEYRRVWWALIVPAWLGAAIAVVISYDGYRMFM